MPAQQPGEAPLCIGCGGHRDSNIHIKERGYTNYHPYVGGEIVFAVDLGFLIQLKANIHCTNCEVLEFTVKYGAQTKAGLRYDQAVQALGSVILHALAAEGRIDHTREDEHAPYIGQHKP